MQLFVAKISKLGFCCCPVTSNEALRFDTEDIIKPGANKIAGGANARGEMDLTAASRTSPHEDPLNNSDKADSPVLSI